jgi:hypothetical protein
VKKYLNPFKSFIVVDIVLKLWQRIPAPVIHNLEKAKVLKLLFWHLNVDQLPGNYIEFGVAHGHSMRAAVEGNRRSFSKTIGVKSSQRNLYGFDTFEGFKSNSVIDSHATWNGDLFTKSIAAVERRFRHHKNVFFYKVNAVELVSNGIPRPLTDFNISGLAALIMFDMDLYEPTLNALIWVRQLMQPGTFLIFDEFYSFAGSSSKGESKALTDFLNIHKELKLREVMTYGAGGKVFVVDEFTSHT